jgi:hypothetical protein
MGDGPITAGCLQILLNDFVGILRVDDFGPGEAKRECEHNMNESAHNTLL